MTTAYIAETTVNGSLMYLALKGALRRVPFMFGQAGTLQRALERYQRWNRATSFVVTVVSDLETGLKSATANRISTAEFLVLAKNPRRIDTPNAVYKLHPVSGKISKKFYGGGTYGKTWDKPGSLRLHITQNIHRLRAGQLYDGATVYEIVYGTDGITPQLVKTIPIIEFYTRSKDSRKRYQDFMRVEAAMKVSPKMEQRAAAPIPFPEFMSTADMYGRR